MTLVPASAGVASVSAAATSSWPQFARVPTHLNDAPAETGFSQDDVAGLHVAWTAPFGTFASGQGGAAVVDGVAYIGGSAGGLSAFSLSRCSARRCPPPLRRGVTRGGGFRPPAGSRGPGPGGSPPPL